MEDRLPVSMRVDGRRISATIRPRHLLSDFLREQAATGVHVACGLGICGACTVGVDGVPTRACLMLAIQADRCEVQTVASLPALEGGTTPGADGLTPLQSAFRRCHALQCGFCTPGLLVSTAFFLARNPCPDREAILAHLNGHLCRCTGYANIVSAIESLTP